MISVKIQLLFLALLCITQIVRSKEETTQSDQQADSLSRTKRAGINMLRLGRGLQMLRLGKRAGLPMFRMGRSQPELNEDELREIILEILMQQEAEKASGEEYNYPESIPHPPFYPRFKRSVPEYPDSDKDVIGIPDLGKLHEGGVQDENEESKVYEEEYFPDAYPVVLDDAQEADYNKRALGMLRLGRSGTGEEDTSTENKRAMNMLRMGKRPMSMLRMGKRPMGMLRMGKRPMGMLRMGKRPMSMLRMGKRPMSMLRMGKRPMSMLRMGKRPMSMLRMGKRPMGMLRMGKRPMSMLRMGKRPMSMLRMGKKSDDDDHSVETRGLSMLRLGRST